MIKYVFSISIVWLFASINYIKAQYRYTGKVVSVKGSCTWLIQITESDEPQYLNKLVEPTGEFPEHFQRKRLKLTFEMHLLRQPITEGCKANFVGSIIDPAKVN
jgi:hypothetical protein